ncbi:DUF483 domain-containing protein [Candidatus Woesearchaeota archaeon]|nr:DUF483 domain-containing protein [Candidatus Woesearchaeota archaeon]
MVSLLDSLQPIFGSKTKAQEVALLLQDAKKVVRQGFYAHELSAVKNFCLQKEISCATSKFKIIIDDTDDIYSNRGLKIPEKDLRQGMFFVYLSKSERLALLAAYYEQLGNDRELGLLLGYPHCCVEFFCKNFSNSHTNLEQFPSNPYTNLFQRKNDAVLISHFPCASSCEKSIALAKNYLRVLEEIDEARAEELLRQLRVNKILK